MYNEIIKILEVFGMKKFLSGALCGVLLCGIAAASGLVASPSTQKFFVDGRQADLTAYEIEGRNYLQLRDVGRAVGFGVTFDAATDSVYIDTQSPYVEETPPPVEKIPIAEKVLDGSEWAREDFSQQANPAVFDDVYTRAAYNALRQSIVDRDAIIAGNDENGFNPFYRYAHFIDPEGADGRTIKAMNEVLGRLDASVGLYWFTMTTEYARKPNEFKLTNISKYPGYKIFASERNQAVAPANAASNAIISEVNAFLTDKEKIKKLSAYLCEKMVYDLGESSSINEIFTSGTPSKGACATYAKAFAYLCERAQIPCVTVSGENHSWNAVYADGEWLNVDITNADVDVINESGVQRQYDPNNPRDLDLFQTLSKAYILTESYKLQDEKPKSTVFAKEVLVPNSSK
jgi:hypothetical protein